jgi:hypothetical protein
MKIPGRRPFALPSRAAARAAELPLPAPASPGAAGHAFGDVRVHAPVLQRQPAPAPAAAAPAAAALPSAEELTKRLARCIGVWETNRGKDDPNPTESTLDTVAGVKASMATIEQATMAYSITALKKHKTLRDAATPALTKAELNKAEARVLKVDDLLAAVSKASKKGTTPDDFIKAEAALIADSGLSDADVRTMFSAVTLKGTIDAASTESKKEKKDADRAKKVQEAIDAIPAADRLGLGEGSLRAYINKTSKWGENKAAWHRKAVAGMTGDVATRIEAVAVSDSGTGLAIPVIRSRVDAQLAKTPKPSLEEIVKAVAQQNNPGEAKYGDNVWATYKRLYP